ncbi:glycosyltransferase [Thiomicrorhabdus cannonii]|uniref:glycosyltransferase n=1 Tax=Thiomicrorhabdus cannonii TaxID=2748011 RepID=UPI0015BC25F1|nr:glycosyltransferase [Thiomicrorhabdus cannonii]
MHIISVVALFISIVFGTYAYFNQPIEEPAWPDDIPGFAFSPYQKDQSPFLNKFPTPEQIEQDLKLLSGKADAIRTYTVDGVFGEIPALAYPYKINIALGAWLDKDQVKNQREVETLIQLIEEPPYNIVRALVGNEVLLREDLNEAELIAWLQQVRQQVKVPVSTAEPWHVWMKHPELAEQVDYIAVHMLPFWEGVALKDAVDYIVAKMNLLKAAFPNKPIVITEVGWPSKGRTIKQAVASRANQAIFMRRFIHRAKAEGYVFYMMEAFDQPWKSAIEGSVGGHWGLYDVNRKLKFEQQTPIIALPQWHFLAAASAILAVVLITFLLIDSGALRKRGRSFLAFLAFAISSLMIWLIYDYSQEYHTWIGVVVGVLLLLGVVGVILVILAEAHEWAEAIWFKQRRRPLVEMPLAEGEHPFVSIHVPAYNEPPEMMKETLYALSQLDYPCFEVLVIDNNTRDETVWRPVEAYCQELGERFRFYHVAPLSGFKAGALNYALARTDERAEVIAVIDSDYVVRPDWLQRMVGQFKEPQVAIVQAPQDYSDYHQNAFKAMCYAEYKGFFHIGMVTRNERNAIIQHGTMTMVRRGVLEEVGGWGETTITEDAELGLRIFENGYSAVYSERSFGKGLMPDTYIDYKKQRYRWAYGAMQILREHAAAFLDWKKTKLKPGQRYHFFAGWLPWIADGFNYLFTLLAIVWTLLMLYDPIHYNAPDWKLALIPIFFFGFKISKMMVLYMGHVGARFGTAVAAATAGLALSHTIAKAVLYGLFIGRKMPFLRTPKLADSHSLWQALIDAYEEALMAMMLVACAIALYLNFGFETLEVNWWLGVLLVQSLPYFASLVLSVISAMPRLSGAWIGFKAD